MGSRPEHWSELPLPPPGALPDPGVESQALTSPALAAGFFTAGASPSQVLSRDWLVSDSLHPRGLSLGLFLQV